MALRNACQRGHEFTADNTQWRHRKKGVPYRVCRICKRDKDRKARAIAGVRPMPSQEFLLQVFSYDRSTGLLTRKRDGAIASNLTKRGYRSVRIAHGIYKAHRVVWRMMVDNKVPDEIDHINGDRADNRLENLRPADHAQNMRNSAMPKSNTSGLKGVTSSKRRWRATITVDGKQLYLGLYDTKEAAHTAYVDAAIRHHGEFANDGFRSLASRRGPKP